MFLLYILYGFVSYVTFGNFVTLCYRHTFTVKWQIKIACLWQVKYARLTDIGSSVFHTEKKKITPTSCKHKQHFVLLQICEWLTYFFYVALWKAKAETAAERPIQQACADTEAGGEERTH